MVRSQFLARLARLRVALAESGHDGLLVSDPANVRYLTGFAGSFSRLVVGMSAVLLVADRRYCTVDAHDPPVHELVCVKGVEYVDATVEAVRAAGARCLAFEPGNLSWWEVRALQAALPVSCRMVPAGGQVESLRRIKDEGEITAMRAAAAATLGAMTDLFATAEPGVTEIELASQLASALRRRGEGTPAFEPMVASGPRTAIIHARPAQRRIAPGDLLLVDAGATVDGMAADFCRTVVVGGRPDARQASGLAVVREALEAAISAVGPDEPARAVDQAARRVLADHGHPTLHDIGHGVGLDVHEEPRLSDDSEIVLEAGMVIAIEPGLYIAGWGGIRMEELVLVTPDGAERLGRPEVALV